MPRRSEIARPQRHFKKSRAVQNPHLTRERSRSSLPRRWQNLGLGVPSPSTKKTMSYWMVRGTLTLQFTVLTLAVLDLPQLYTKPTEDLLITALNDIILEPHSWDVTPASGASTPASNKQRKIKSEGLPCYLTKIIASELTWIQDEEKREQIWELASRRLGERSGRTGMGALNRTFAVPLHEHVGLVDCSAGVVESVLHLTIHEPALTSDNLGLKTWASSYLLAKRLAAMWHTLPSSSIIDGKILELGAGTGLVGLSAAAVFPKSDVYLTDLPAIVPNLEHNTHANLGAIASSRCSGKAKVWTGVLDWTDPTEFYPNNRDFNDGDTVYWPAQAFQLILAADPIYSSDHPEWLVQTISHHLRRDPTARVVMEMPLREAFGAERNDFRERMGRLGLQVLEEGEETGFDDWSIGGDLVEVRCWWSVWSWA